MAKANSEDRKRRKERAEEWRQFRREHLFTQKRLADVISHSVGNISRRTIQQIEAARITPHPDTLRLFAAFKKKYEAHV